MSMTTAQAFERFVAGLGPTTAQTADIEERVSIARNLVQKAFPPSSDLTATGVTVIGSASRGTVVRPVNDIDVMARFDNKGNVFEKYRGNSVSFLARVRDAMSKVTRVEQVGARGQAVRLFYTQGAHVDIAPVFKWSGAGFALPAGDRTWMTTDPDAQAAWFNGRKAAVGANLVPLIRVAKRWNGAHSRRLGSYHLEVMVASMFRTLSPNYRSAMRCFFEWAPKWISVQDPAGHSGDLGGTMSEQAKAALIARLGEAQKRAEQAIAAEERGDHGGAKRLWRIELGDGFPID